MNKLGNFFSGLLGVIIGCVITLVAIVPQVNNVNLKETSNNAVNVLAKEKKEDHVLYNDTRDLYKNVAKSAMPSVVGITTVFLDDSSQESYFDYFFGFGGPQGPRVMQGLGTGVIVDKSGYILTNAHVIEDGKAQKVNVLFHEGETKEADVKWYDSNLDLAIIKVEGDNYPVATLGDSDQVEVGDIAIAIGNPLGLEFERTVTQGIISGLGRTVSARDISSMNNLLQTDASINQGNSGGPLLNAEGEVIGINTIKVGGGEGLGFSIPINTAKVFVNIMKDKGEIKAKPILGIQGATLQQIKNAQALDTKTKDGVLVRVVYDKSPAKKAGLKEGDIIIQLNEDKIKNMSDLQASLYKYGQDIDKEVEITVERKKKEETLKFKLMTEEDVEKMSMERSPLSIFFGENN